MGNGILNLCDRLILLLRPFDVAKPLLRVLRRLLRIGLDARALLVGFREPPFGLGDDLAIRYVRAWHIGTPCTSATLPWVLRAAKPQRTLLKPQSKLILEHRSLFQASADRETSRSLPYRGVALMSNGILPPIVIPPAIVAALVAPKIYRTVS